MYKTSDIVFNKCWSFTVASVTFNYEGEIKTKASTSVKLCTQAIKMLMQWPRNKIILTLKKNMIPNIKSSEVLETVSWKKVIHAWAQSLSCSACFRNPVRIPVHHQSEMYQLPRFCHWEKQLRKIINGAAGLRSVHYKEGTEFSGSGFNADYYDLIGLVITIMFR
jgi:hypothetical protein